MSIKKINVLLLAVIAVMSAAVSTAANAALDPQITTAIADARTDSLAVAGLMTTMCAVVWGAMFLKKKFFG
jgi:Inovirus Coat protein B